MSKPRPALSNETVKQLTRCYNKINKEIYGFGVTQLKVAADEGIISFYVKHQRVTALKALEARYEILKQAVDHALHTEFKLRLRKRLEETFGLKAAAILRDYDPATEWAVTVVITDN